MPNRNLDDHAARSIFGSRRPGRGIVLLGSVLLLVGLVVAGCSPQRHSALLRPTPTPAGQTADDVAASTGCHQFITAPTATPAFCDTLGVADPTAGTRSGALNGVLWGVSRATQNNNESQGQFYDWAASTQNRCGTNVQVAPDHDVNVCGGQLVESVNDAGEATVLGMYPRQPFNFAGRTGTIEFNVSDNTQGGHGAWPVLAITDQPVPAPYGNLPGISDNARNSVIVELDNVPGNVGCVNANIEATVNYNYVSEPTTQSACVPISSGSGHNNHVEIQINSGGVKVYMSRADEPATTTLITTSSFAVPLTQGLVWPEDVHYNGNKFGDQGTDTLTWSDLAFDGPVLPRDLGFDVLDNTAAGGTAPNGQPMTNLGYPIPSGGRSLTLRVSGVTAADIARASGALLTMNYFPQSAQTLSYTINGHGPLKFAWPYANDSGGSSGPTFVSQSVALPVPLADVVSGTNTVTLSTSDTTNGVNTANFDLILQGAGGVIAPPAGNGSAGAAPIAILRTATYWLVGADGGIFAFHAPFYGSTGNVRLNQPIVGMAADPRTGGYWLVAADGGIFAFHAPFYGSTGNVRLNQPIVGMASTSDGKGYWLVARDGGIFSFGDAPFYGSTGNTPLNQPIVGMTSTHDGKGYWLVARDGGIFAFGDARFYGSTGNTPLNQPIVGVAADPRTGGYWLVAADGGIFAFHAPFYGSTGNVRLNQPIVGMASTSDGKGYWLVARDGGIFAFGDAPFYGSTGNMALNQPILGVATP